MRNCSPWLSACEICQAPPIVMAKTVTSAVESHARDDPRITGYPCFGSHSDRLRQNQHAVWQVCSRCGFRTSYTSKKGKTGEYRHMGPDPTLLKAILDDFQDKKVPAESMTEAIIMGRLMEVKGRLLQTGESKTMSLTMKLEDYRKRIGEMSPKKKTPTSQPDKTSPTPLPDETVNMMRSQLYREMMESVKDSPEDQKILEKAASSLGIGLGMDWEKIPSAEEIASSEEGSPKNKQKVGDHSKPSGTL